MSSEGKQLVVAEPVARRGQGRRPPCYLTLQNTFWHVGAPLTARLGVHADCAASWTTFWKARAAAARHALLEFQLEFGHVAVQRLNVVPRAESGAGQPIPLPNVSALSLEHVLRYYEQRVAEAGAATERRVTELKRQTLVAQSARRLAAEAETTRAAAAERERGHAAEAAEAAEAQQLPAEAQGLAAEAAALNRAAAQDAEHLSAEAAEAECLAAAAEEALQQLSSSAVAEPGAPAALGVTGETFASWEETFIAQTGAASLLQLISVRSQAYLPPRPSLHQRTSLLRSASRACFALWLRRRRTTSRPTACWT